MCCEGMINSASDVGLRGAGESWGEVDQDRTGGKGGREEGRGRGAGVAGTSTRRQQGKYGAIIERRMRGHWMMSDSSARAHAHARSEFSCRSSERSEESRRERGKEEEGVPTLRSLLETRIPRIYIRRVSLDAVAAACIACQVKQSCCSRVSRPATDTSPRLPSLPDSQMYCRATASPAAFLFVPVCLSVRSTVCVCVSIG